MENDRAPDLEPLRRLLFRCCQCIDALDLDGLEQLLSPDVRMDFGAVVAVGFDQVRSQIARNLSAYSATSHQLSNLCFELHGPRLAEADSYVHAWHRVRADGSSRDFYGRYYDELRHDGSVWRLAARRIRVLGLVGYPADMAFEGLPRGGSARKP